MFAEGIFPIGDGLLDIDEERLKDLLVPHDINEIYEVEQTPFARGKFAAVRRAIHKNSGTHFAAKFLKRRRRAQSSDKEIKHEIAVLMLCNEADNIVKLNAVHESRSDTALLLELATGGELQTFLDNEECLSEAQARICMRQVLKALQFLHKRSIVHLDLKPQNILLAGERIEDGLKLCDFGISRVVAEGTNVREIVGTPDYVAPEVLQYEPLSLLTDIWSVGVLAYVLLSGFSPFGGETKQETFLNISQCALTFPDKLFGGVSSAAIDFIRKALRIKPNDRMTAAGCLEHIWLKDECNIDRHIFNAITNKQQLEHDDDDDDEEDDVDVDDDDVEDDADVDVDDEDHVVDVDVANNVEAQDNDQQNKEVKETTTNTIADDDNDEVQIIKDKLPQAISVDNSEEEDNNTSNNSFTKTVNKPFSKSTITNTINNTTTQHHHHHRSSSNGGLTNGHSKSHSNNSLTNGHSNGLANGHHYDYTTNGYANGHISSIATKGSGHGHHMYNSYTKLREELNDKSAKLSLVRPSMSGTTTTKTTAVHNVTATKAITIPLCSVQPQLQSQQQTLTTTPQEQQQQQLLHIPARRHSSESNKENTFLTTKKITANIISNGSSSQATTLKKTSTSNNSTSTNPNSISSFSTSTSSSTSLSTIPNPQSATATATIHITPNPTLNNNSNIVATITLPTAASVSVVNGVNISSDKTVVNTAATANNHHSLFPDAPTTPKVIRKAPTTDASPTSVKALVKKFQLEGGDQTITPPEFATNGSKHNHQQQHQHQHQHQLHNQSQTKYNSVRSTLSPPSLAHSSAITIMNSSRRASEPITTIHMNNNNNNNNSNKKITSTSAPVSIPASAANNFKTTCVYCVSCTNSLTNGCRHPNSSTNNISTSLASTTTATKYSSNTHSSSSISSSTKSLNNGIGNNTVAGNTTTANSSSNGSSSSQALLFGQHTQHLMNSSHQQQQQQHLNHHHNHHHHHHTHHHLHHHGVVVKNANASANGLSLDQGIIC